MRIPTYQDVINEARTYRVSNTLADLRHAELILRKGLRDHVYALPIGDELVIVLEKQNRDQDALNLLKELENRHRNISAETLCRFAKLLKKEANRLAKGGNPAAAIPKLAEAERYYGRAFEKSNSFYSRINQLTTRFVRSALLMQINQKLESEQLLREVREDAAHMLTNSSVWQAQLNDDDIWIPATQGEVNLLLGRWNDSANAYSEAMQLAKGQTFYSVCMKDQVKMLLEAYQKLKIDPTGPLADPELFFTFSSAVSMPQDQWPSGAISV